jgi:hypothetical protein
VSCHGAGVGRGYGESVGRRVVVEREDGEVRSGETDIMKSLSPNDPRLRGQLKLRAPMLSG